MKDLRFHSFLIVWMKFRVMKFRVKDQMLNVWECDTVVDVVSWPSCCWWMKKNWLTFINAETFLFWMRNDWLLFRAMTANQSQNDWFLLILNDWLPAFLFWARKPNSFLWKFFCDLRKNWSHWVWHFNFCNIIAISKECYNHSHDYMNHHW